MMEATEEITPPILTETSSLKDDNAESQSSTHKRIVRLIVALLLLGFIAFVIADSLTNKLIPEALRNFLQWVEQEPVAGIFAFMGVYIIATVLFIPGSALTLGIGFIFANALGLGLGVLFATIAIFIGAGIGAILAFLLGRYLLRERTTKLTAKYPLFQAIDVALLHRGFRIMTLLRLSPIIPFNALNYIAGVTAITLKDYALAMFAILPGTLLYVFIGASAGSLFDIGNEDSTETESSSNNRTVQIVTIVVGIVFGILGIGTVSYYAKKELNSTIETVEDNNPDIEITQQNDGDDSQA